MSRISFIPKLSLFQFNFGPDADFFFLSHVHDAITAFGPGLVSVFDLGPSKAFACLPHSALALCIGPFTLRAPSSGLLIGGPADLTHIVFYVTM